MVTITDPLFKNFFSHVIKWEGGTSSDQRDTASSCMPGGGIHTNKGVTYCTFKANAQSLGITPVTHARFVSMTNADVEKFVFLFMKEAGANLLPAPLAFAVTEAAWGSGASRAIMHLQTALNRLGYALNVDGKNGTVTTAAALKADQTKLYSLYWSERRNFINSLAAKPKYAMYKNGWNNRINDFLKKFPIGTVIKAAAGGLGLATAFFLPFIF